MNKIEIKNLYLIFGSEKQKALRMLKEEESKNEILKISISKKIPQRISQIAQSGKPNMIFLLSC